LNTGQKFENHDWNELHLEDGRKFVVDPSALPPQVRFLDIPQGAEKLYQDVAGQPMYASPPQEPSPKKTAK